MKLLTGQAEEKTRQQRLAFREEYLKNEWKSFCYWHNDEVEKEEKERSKTHAVALRNIRDGLVKCQPRRNRQEPM